MRVSPPIVALGLVAAAGILHVLLDPRRLVPPPWNELGLILLPAGAALILWPIVMFRRAHTSHLPEQEPRTLVLGGPYRFTRNPMYLGLTTILTGFAIVVGTWPLFLAPPAFAFIMDRTQIPREEARLEGAFGAEFERFRRSVRRWL